MTRSELHQLPGFHPDTLRAAALHLRVAMPRKAATDATLIVNHEGWMNGYLDAIEALMGAIVPEKPQKERPAVQPYSRPQSSTENPNQSK